MIPSSPKPWTLKVMRQPFTENVYFLRIDDANGNKVATLSPHESVGGRGLDQVTADATLIIALVNSPAAAAFERESTERRAAPVEIPESERTPAAMARLL